VVTGIVKCVLTPLKYFTPKDLTLQDIGTDVISLHPLLKGPVSYVCIAQETLFSVVDEDFANCLVLVSKSTIFYFFAIILIVSTLLLIFLKGTPGPNRFGPAPEAES